jgi:MoaA/NifB/PqqE/SkfB family radical SAM enzyme
MWQSKDDSASIEIDAWERFIDSFERFVGNKAQVQFVGGEPLLKKGVLDLVRHTAKKGFSTTMTTNAFLMDEKMINGIIDSGLNTVVLSLDSIKKQIHDFLRGIDGVYDRLMKAIELLSKRNNNSLRVHIVTTIMQPNLDDLLELVEWVNQNDIIKGISFQAVMQPFFTPMDDNWYKSDEFSFLWPKDIDKVDFILDRLVSLKKQGYKITNPVPQFNVFKSYFRHPERFVKVSRCNLGYNSVSVNTSGKIFLCLSQEPIGDIRDSKSMEEVWFSEKAEEVRESIKNCKNNCKLMINCFFEEEVAV